MKINNKKIIVSTLALAVGAALAGSISGSVAWYQYSTRAAALVAGTSAGTSRNLQISKDNGTSWGQYVSFDAVNFRPSSIVAADLDSGETTITAAKDHPVYQYANLPTIGTGTGEIANKQTVDAVEYYAYQEYTFVFKCEDTKNNSKAQVAKDVYLSKLEIVNTGTNDITAAVRISIDGANGFLVSKAGGETATAGQLDINDNDANDTNYWDTQDAASRVTDGDAEYITYTSGAAKYTTVAQNSTDLIPNTTNAYSFSGGAPLTTTKVSGASDAITIRVWLEGWQQLEGSALWDTKYQAQNFEIRMQFQCEADVD